MRNYQTYDLVMWVLIFPLFIVGSCSQQKFDKNKWSDREDPAFPPSSRPKMLDDLITNHNLVGLSYQDLIARLGKPDNIEKNFIIYKIVVEYGSNIDPIYTKNLEFTISSDSSTMSLKVKEWKVGNDY